MRTKLIFSVLLYISSFLFSQTIKQDSTSINFLSDNEHTGVFTGSSIASSPEVKYLFRTNGAVRSSPAVYQNKIFFGCGDTYLYCLDENSGNEIWKFKSGGAITSSPTIHKDKIFFSSKDGFLYCIDANDGIQLWKFDLGKDLVYRWEFDYYLSSPTLFEEIIYIGSGDGNLYAINSVSGKKMWNYFTGSRIRSTPAISNGILYFGDFAGKLYAIELKTQKAKWIYETEGSKIKIEDFVFDRTALVSSPTIYDGVVLVGSREGCLYCVDLETGKLNWKDDQKMSWVISTPTIFRGNVIAGTSDGHFVNSLNIKTGNENWRYLTTTPIWSSVAIAGSVAYAGDYDCNFFALDAASGKKLWEFKTEDRIHSSPVVHNGVIYFGSDDGYLYAIKGSAEITSRKDKSRKAVYWEESKGYNWFTNKTDEFIRDFFIRQGYELVNESKLGSFIKERLKDHLPSAVVFARNEFPPLICNDSAKSDLLREYLKGDNKIVLLGENPLAYIKDKTGKLIELDYRRASKYFGIDYGGELTDAMKGLYPCNVTEEGMKIGLRGFWVSLASVSSDQVTAVYAKDENERAGAWLKNYGGPKNSGLMQLWINRQFPSSLAMIKNAVEFGLQ